jgi:3-phosphoshikimate 1-carboxyvinyltransferase
MPGDKSISHRAAIIAALCQGTSRLRNFASGDDCAATLRCLTQLGVSVRREGQDVLLDSRGKFSPPAAALDCGNSGSTLRMLAGVLAGQSFDTTLTGDASLLTRPMGRIIEPLKLMGARIDSQCDRAPLGIKGSRSLKPISYELPVASAQVKSSILFAALNTEGRTEVIEKTPTRDHTERMLQWFDVPIEILNAPGSAATRIAIEGVANLRPHDVSIPGDISSAAFFIAAAALLPDSDLVIDFVGLNPSRTKFLETLRSQYRIEVQNEREECNEPLGSVHVR